MGYKDNKIMKSKTNTDVERFNRRAASYEKSVRQKLLFGPVQSQMLNLLIREGPKDPPGCIIDIGYGTGRLLRTASEHWAQAQLFGVDPAEQMISEAHRLNPKVTFKIASAESLPFPDQTADIILSSLSFHHWADPQKSFQEIARVLRPGGWFCLADLIIPLAALFHDKFKNYEQIRKLMIGAGLIVRQHQRVRMRFVLITLAQKPFLNP